MLPLNDPVRQLVYAERGAGIDFVMVAGEPVMQEGKLTKIEIRFESIRNVSANAKRTSASLPVAAAGSGTPQCAVIGWPSNHFTSCRR